jgi:hypothetical protein
MTSLSRGVAVAVACAVAAVATAATTATAQAQTAWTLEAIGRPLTMPGGTFLGGLQVTASPTVGADDDITLFDTIPLLVVGAFGITDELEVNASYTLTLSEFEAKGPLRAGLGYAILRGAAGGKLEVIARAEAGYDFLNETMGPIVLGPQIQFNLTSTVALVSPASWLFINIDSPVNDGPTPIFLNLPIGVLVQATPQLFVQVDTTIATIEIADSDTAVIGDEVVPVGLTLGYTPSRNLDLGLTVSDDLKHADDTLAVGIFLRYYGGV